MIVKVRTKTKLWKKLSLAKIHKVKYKKIEIQNQTHLQIYQKMIDTKE